MLTGDMPQNIDRLNRDERIHTLARRLHLKTRSKIVLVVADGLGGLPMDDGDETELEAATTPNLDALANEGTTGLLHPVSRGITCGSGPGHLALFGYDRTKFIVSRGVLSALGVDFDLQSSDVAARGNFCTVDQAGKVTDRRVGRIADDVDHRLVDKLQTIKVSSCRPDRTSSFGEREAIAGGLGQFPATELMPLAMAHAGKVDKLGA